MEMVMWKMYGDYLEGSGWTNALTQAAIASSGTADSFLRASYLTRTRHTHQVTALALAKLQEDAFMHTEGTHSDEAKEAWRKEMVQKSPTFQYWIQFSTWNSWDSYSSDHTVRGIFLCMLKASRLWFHGSSL